MSDDERTLKMARHYHGEDGVSPAWSTWREEALQQIERIEAADLLVIDPASQALVDHLVRELNISTTSAYAVINALTTSPIS